jgi:hypothetical protein
MTQPSKVSSVLSILKEWDKQTKFSSIEQELIDRIQLKFERDNNNLPNQTQGEHESLLTIEDFYKEFNHVEGSIYENIFIIDDNKREYIERLSKYKAICQDITNQINHTIDTCEQLQAQYKNVCQKTGKLHVECETLVTEKEDLLQISNQIKEALDHFDDMEEFSNELNASHPTINIELFSTSLKRLDESLDFLLRNIEYREAKSYIAKYRVLQSRALAQLRDQVLTVLKATTYNIQTEIAKCIKENSYNPEKEMSFLYIEFRLAIEPLKSIIHEIELRAHRSEYTVFIIDCFECYSQQRNALLYDTVHQKINTLATTKDLSTFVREGCGYMIKLCSEEDELFRHFFSCNEVMPYYRALVESFCNIMYDTIRSLLIHENNIDILCDLIELLRIEILSEGIKPRGASAAAFEPIVHHMIQDIQERLIYRASVYISDVLRTYRPSPEELSYPDILIKARQQQENQHEQKFSPVNEETSLRDAQSYSRRLLDNNLPTLRMGISFLTKLYQSLDVGVFEGLAHEVVAICTNSFIDASKKISEKKSIIDGELFLIRHLFLLHEHISMFNVSFSKTETELDFSQLREGIIRFLKGQAGFRVKDIIFDIMSQGRPRIVYTSVDSKKDLEKQLETACESFILNATRQAFDPCMAYLKRLSVMIQQDKNNQQSDSAAFVSIDLAETLAMYKKIAQMLPEVLQQLSEKLPLYLTKVNHQNDLFNAVKQSIMRIFEQLLKQIEKYCRDSQKKEELLRSMWTMQDIGSIFQQYDEKLKKLQQ